MVDETLEAEREKHFGAEPGQDPPDEPTVGDPPPPGEPDFDGTENLPAEVAQAVAPVQGEVLSPLDMPTEQFQAGLKRRGDNRKILMKWLKDALVDGTDYGKIHVVGKNQCQEQKNCKIAEHWSKETLFKPGAEKILGHLGLTADYPTLADYEAACLKGVTIDNIILRCEIKDGRGQIVVKGIGARRCQKQDYGDINKSLKMAKKSGLIDGTLGVGGLSELFTQDMEDKPDDEELKRLSQPDPSQAPPPYQAPYQAQQQRRQEPTPSSNGGNYVTEPMRKAIWASIKAHFVIDGIKDNSVVNEFSHWMFKTQSMNFIEYETGRSFLDQFGRDKDTKVQKDHEGFKSQLKVFEGNS